MKKICRTTSRSTLARGYTDGWAVTFRQAESPADQGYSIMHNSAQKFGPTWLLLLLLIPGGVYGQSGMDNSYYGYLSGGAGVTSAGTGLVSVAGGGEVFVHPSSGGLAIGGELAAIAPPTEPREVIGVLSPNLSWHFRAGHSPGRVEPFITGGYSLFFRSGSLNGLNFGGGAIWWFREGIGLRLEARDLVPLTELDRHIVLFRAGIAFR